jgi:fatty-acyl-CoA synthase
MDKGAVCFKLVGEGDLPINDMMNALRSVSYDGFVSLELDPKQVEDFGVPEILFPHFLHSMERYTKKEHGGHRLYSNKTGTGNFVMEKGYPNRTRTFSQVP